MDGRTEATVEDLGAVAAMTTNDVLHTLYALNMIKINVSDESEDDYHGDEELFLTGV
jgi:hypothetical protein